jgi:hypothetical protein
MIESSAGLRRRYATQKPSFGFPRPLKGRAKFIPTLRVETLFDIRYET